MCDTESGSSASFHESPKMGEYSSVSMQFPSGQASAPPWPAPPSPPHSQAASPHSPALHSGSRDASTSAKKTEEHPKEALHKLCRLQLPNQESVLLDEEWTKTQSQDRSKQGKGTQ